jgi:GT2 family glycosyltransferase
MEVFGVSVAPIPDLSIVIVSWNVEKLILDCLRSIYETGKDLLIEVIVVDNDSTDATVEQVRQQFPQTHVIVNKYNAGFARANNQALALCRGRNILLLNPDTIVTEGALRKMMCFADSHPEVGLVGPRLQSPDGSIQYCGARSFPTPLGYFWYYSFIGQVFPHVRQFGKLYLSCWDHATNRQVEAIAGAAMLIPRRTLVSIGFLDESHPMYLEDIDYCFRVYHSGKQVFYLSDAIIIHYGGQSSSQVFIGTKILILEAIRLFFSRYGRRYDGFAFRLLLVLAALIRFPVLSAIKIWSMIKKTDSARVRRISLQGELVTLWWSLGLARTPQIEKISV